MQETTVKAKVLQAIEELPSNVTYEDVMERLYMLYKLERGMQQHRAGEGVSQEEARQRMKRWHE